MDCNSSIELNQNIVDVNFKRINILEYFGLLDLAIEECEKVKSKSQELQLNYIIEGLKDKKQHYKLDCNKILNVNKDFSLQDIKKSYRNLCLMWHPDKHQKCKNIATELYKAI